MAVRRRRVVRRKRKRVMRRKPNKFLRRTSGNFVSASLMNGRISTELKAYDKTTQWISGFNGTTNPCHCFSNEDNTVITGNGPFNMMLLNSPGGGTDINQRVGRKIMMKSIMIRIDVSWFPVSGLANAQAIRYLLVLDRQANGLQPKVQDILATVGSTELLMTAPLNLDNRDRFVVLTDKIASLGVPNVNSGATTTVRKEIKIYKKLNTEVVYIAVLTSPPDVVSTIATNALWLIMLSTELKGTNSALANVGNVSPLCRSVHCRMRFKDP